jgi:hypothetical protein
LRCEEDKTTLTAEEEEEDHEGHYQRVLGTGGLTESEPVLV